MSRWNTLWLVVVGLLLGWSYLVREFILVIFPVVLVVLAIKRARWNTLIPIAVGALAVFAVEVAYNGLVLDDPLLRIRQVMSTSTVDSDQAVSRIQSRQQARGGVVDRLLILPRILTRTGNGWSSGWLLLGLGATGVAAIAADGRRRGLPLVLWAVAIWVLLIGSSFVPVGDGRVLLHPLLVRYWYPIFPPLVIAGLGGISVLLARKGSRMVARLAVGVAALAAFSLSVMEVERYPWTYRSGADELHQLRDYFTESQPAATRMWTTMRRAWTLPMFVHEPFGRPIWDGEIRSLNWARSFKSLDAVGDGDLILIDDQFFEARHSNWRGAVPPELMAIPDDWNVRFVATNSELALLEASSGDDEWVAEYDPATDWTWTALPRGGSRLAGPTPLDPGPGSGIAVPDGSQIVVIDGAAPSIAASERGLPVTSGTFVRFEVDLGAEGAGNVLPRCLFYTTEGRVHTDPVTFWGVPADYGSMEGLCRAPEGATRFRVAFRVTGPATLQLGQLRIGVDRDGTDLP